MVAFLAGSVLLNVFTQEIPTGGQSHYGWSMVGMVLYAILLSLVTLLHEHL